jgi:hypothetical protein
MDRRPFIALYAAFGMTIEDLSIGWERPRVPQRDMAVSPHFYRSLSNFRYGL